MKRIFIEDGLALYNKTGIGQYTISLAQMLEGLGYEVVMPRKYFLEKIKNASIKRVLYILWLNLVFPFLLLFSGCEKIIFSNFLTPLYKIPTKKYYPVVHDLWAVKFPETMSKTKKDYQTWILKVIKNNYYKIITVSNTVKQEIIDYFGCNPYDINVIYNYFSFGENPKINLTEEEQMKILENLGIKSKEYILSVGSLNKRKNIQMLIDAYNLVSTNKKLVIVGKKENANLLSENKNIIFTGYVEDEELKVLYKNAMLFVFPSIYEGFGIPLIDAQAFGIPVLCSDIPVFREIGGTYVKYFSLNKICLIKMLQLILSNEELYTLQNKDIEQNLNRFKKNIIKKSIEGVLN